jgi:hypothetical protein
MSDIVNRFPILSVRLQWSSKEFNEYVSRVSNLIYTTLILQNVCLEHNDIWASEMSDYQRDGPMLDGEEPAADDLDGKELQDALYRYINARIDFNATTGKVIPKAVL